MNTSQQTTAEHELALLRCILHKPGIIDELGLSIDLFQEPSSRCVFSAIGQVRESGLVVEEIALTDKLRAMGSSDYIGFMAGLEHWTAANAGYYADQLREAARLRALAPVLRDGLEAIAAGRSSHELAEEVERGIMGAINLAPEIEDVSTAAILPDYFRSLEHDAIARKEGRADVLEMGIPEIDSIIGPMHGGEVVVIAARTGAGKTALALQWAAHVAVELRKPTAYFSLEMPRNDILDRLMSQRTTFTLSRLRDRRIEANGRGYSELLEVGETLRAAPLSIFDSPLSLTLLCSRIRREKTRRGLSLAVVDYFGLLNFGVSGNEVRWERVAAASRVIKYLALELKIVICLCVQLNRDADRREPTPAQLRDSGGIEQDADRVILLHRKNEAEAVNPRPVTAIVAKTRHSSDGRAELLFDGPHTHFMSV